jgi:hypothetical protein
MQVRFAPEVLDYFNETIIMLLDKEYFGTFYFADLYVRKLIDEIVEFLPIKLTRVAPAYFQKYAHGEDLYYTTFIHSKTTQWYVFFSVIELEGETIYLVQHVSNNHIDSCHLFPR